MSEILKDKVGLRWVITKNCNPSGSLIIKYVGAIHSKKRHVIHKTFPTYPGVTCLSQELVEGIVMEKNTLKLLTTLSASFLYKLVRTALRMIPNHFAHLEIH